MTLHNVIIYINVDNIVTSKLVKTKSNSKYLIGYLVLIVPKMNRYVQTFKVKEEDKDSNKLMSFHIDD